MDGMTWGGVKQPAHMWETAGLRDLTTLGAILRKRIARDEEWSGEEWSSLGALGEGLYFWGKSGAWGYEDAYDEEGRREITVSVRSYSKEDAGEDSTLEDSAPREGVPWAWIRLSSAGGGRYTCIQAAADDCWVKYIRELVGELADPKAAREWARENSSQAKRDRLGTHGGTMDRVREARELVEQGVPKTAACKRVGIDTRTYDRYVDQIIDWGAELEE